VVSLMLWEHQSGVRFPPSPPLARMMELAYIRVLETRFWGFDSLFAHHVSRNCPIGQEDAPEVVKFHWACLKSSRLFPGPSRAYSRTGICTRLKSERLKVQLLLGPPWENRSTAGPWTPNPPMRVRILLLPPFGLVSVVANALGCRPSTHWVNTGGATPSQSTMLA
jgi:hypothetical protein